MAPRRDPDVTADRSFWTGRRVWLTGHTGFKGAWLALWLQALGAEVHGFSAGSVGDPSLYEVADVAAGMAGDVRGDVRSESELRAAIARARPEIVFHLAAQSLVRRGLACPVETFAVNVTGTAKLLDALRTAADAPRAIVVATSDKCYRNDGPGEPFREDDPLGGTDPYSASKAAQEHVAAAFRALGLPVATARAGNVIGGGDWAADRIVADFARAAAAGRPLAVRAPDAVRPWQHVLGPLAGYLLLAERLAGERRFARAWNFGPDPADARSVGWLVEQLSARWPGRPAVEQAPEAGSIEAKVLRLNADAARAQLAWEPALGLTAGLDATVAWYVAHQRGADMRELTMRQIAVTSHIRTGR